MDEITLNQVRTLSEDRQGQCVTIYMPTHPAGADALQDQVRLKNLADRAEQLLADHGMRSAEARDLLKPVRSLPTDEVFWSKRQQGLALFITPGELLRFRLPHAFEECVIVNRRFQVKQLLPLLMEDQSFYILALSKNKPRLIRANRFSAAEVEVQNLPGALNEALNYDGERGTQQHSGARGSEMMGKQGAIFHGHGGGADTAKDEITQYFRLVRDALHPILREQRTPLVLAAVDYLIPIFRETFDYHHVLETPVLGNPDYLSPQQLQEKSWPVVQEHIDRQRQATKARFQELHGTGKASDNIGEVVKAAVEGKVESLLVDCRAEMWGTYDPQSTRTEVHDKPQPGDDDLVDLAASATLHCRGTVFTVARDQLPTDSAVAAIFRY